MEKDLQLNGLANNLYERKKAGGIKLLFEKEEADAFLDAVLKAVYPRCLGQDLCVEDIYRRLELAKTKLARLLTCLESDEQKREAITEKFFEGLEDVSSKLEKDAIAMFESDPAAESLEEVVLTYPGLLAVAVYRIARSLYLQGVRVLPRLLTELGHQKTGVDIHPGARIGESFVIDHGTGVVIGETAVVGDHVKVYQGVTLGALSVEKGLAKKKRHPTIEDHCVVYAHATILGGGTVIGRNSVVGGNVWMTKSVPPHSLVYHKSEVKLDTKLTPETQELTYEI